MNVIAPGESRVGIAVLAQNSRAKTELDFLTAVERGEVVSQQTLSRRVGAAVGLINALLKRAMRKGYVKARSAPAKRWAYYLTPRGFAEKSRLVAEYLEVSLALFRQAREEYEVLFLHAERQGTRKIVLVGAGELAEIAVLAAHDVDLSICAILDEADNRNRIAGCQVVRSLDEAGAFDAVVLTEMRLPQESYERIAAVIDKDLIIVPEFLRVVRDRVTLQTDQRRSA